MTRHLTAEELAELVVGSVTRERAASYQAHIAGCVGCAAALAEAIRYRAAWLRRPQLFGIPEEMTTSPARDSGPRTGPTRAAAGPVIRLRRWLPATGAVTTIVAVVAFALLSRPAAPTLGFRLPPAVRASIETSSARELVLPGGERHAGRPAAEMRSGVSPGSLELTAEVNRLVTHYELAQRSADVAARLVAGLLAEGDLEGANAYAREALRAYPRDTRLLVLMADLNYRASDLPAAERHLRSAAQIAPRDPLVGLDLALVLRERGNVVEAGRWFNRVAASGHPPLAERARQELRR